jgi:hypothetical protein
MTGSTPMNSLARCFGLIFWGLIFVIVNVTLNGFDLLPDFIGYLLVAVGTDGLGAVSRKFSTARTLAWCLVPVSLASLFVAGELGTTLGYVRFALDCFMMWALLGGIMDFAVARERFDLAQRAAARRVAYVVLMCLMKFLSTIVDARGRFAVQIVVALVVCTLIVLVMILHLIHRVKTELAV